MRITHRMFREQSWEQASAEAEQFANRLQPNQLLSISHVSEPSAAVVFVWYVAYDDGGGGRATITRAAGGTA